MLSLSLSLLVCATNESPGFCSAGSDFGEHRIIFCFPTTQHRDPNDARLSQNTMPARRGEGGGGGLASKLFNKFDSDRKYDPFLDTDPVIQDSKEGMVSSRT